MTNRTNTVPYSSSSIVMTQIDVDEAHRRHHHQQFLMIEQGSASPSPKLIGCRWQCRPCRLCRHRSPYRRRVSLSCTKSFSITIARSEERWLSTLYTLSPQCFWVPINWFNSNGGGGGGAAQIIHTHSHTVCLSLGSTLKCSPLTKESEWGNHTHSLCNGFGMEALRRKKEWESRWW